MKNNKDVINITILIIISIALALMTCAYLTLLNNISVDKGNLIEFILKNINITKLSIISVFYSVITIMLYKKGRIIGDFAYKYRFLISGLIFVLCVIFEISGSSIGMWRYFVGNELDGTGDILGIPRAIRGDEWVVFTPFAISQEENDPDSYSYISNIIRGGKTDVYIVYGQPVKDISIIFRPFQVGYLFLGSAKGLAFFWCGRFIALFLVAFELSMVITNKKKNISLIAAILITLAPAVQWWFSVNGFVEMIIFGGVALLLLRKYMLTNNLWKRLLYLIIIGICGGGFILTFYPAWQVPMAYIIIGLAIWVIIENRKYCSIKWKDIFSIIFVLILILGLLFNVYIKSKDTIDSVMHTTYPGSRCETGGENGFKYFHYPSNLFFTLDDQNLGTNVCEAAVFFDIFPIGYILAVIVLFKEKNKDILLIILLILSAFFAVWSVLGFPEILAKITLLYVSPSQRSFVIIGLINILILIRSLALIKTKSINKKQEIIISLISSIAITALCVYCFQEYYSFIKISLTGVILFVFYLAIFELNNEKLKVLSISIITIIMMFMSFLINPIRKGIDVITEQPVGKEIKRIEEEDAGLWIVEGMEYPLFNYTIMYGAPTINSTNVYPNLDRWKKLDPNEEYKEVYNRYAHITIDIVDNEKTKFELLYPDAFKIYLPVDKLKELDIKYVFTSNDLEKFKNEEIDFENIYEKYGIRIFKVIYK